MDRGREMLNVIRDIYNGGKDLIRNWQLLTHATERLQQDGVDGLKRYYEEYTNLPKGRRINDILEGHRRKTLKSERKHFMMIYNSTSSAVGAGDRVVSGRNYPQLDSPTLDTP
jgi:hypothetical protein